ncbi:MAG: chromosome segregation protein SMC, partial [Candidatus Firestonebacteria bacterium]|nr:chromosome segregation protein SMC [Candidatus Firestonebacteria bacterium]
MQLKHVEIFGFKTFADKVGLSFSPGITAVVGPNGCGKTNILDAIRWVLGEQSSKVLRGHKMEDVIYNGGHNRKPLGMAEVSLTLINNKKLLPIEYEEITITRRMYRSGESEYLINQSECRLKDINELFMDTGMGSHVYSIVEQSQIDLILSNNPSVRRMLFEEAAGVMKYKTRKKETLSKLEHTEQNLLRINDIVQEVSQQADVLKTQSARAQKYLGYRDELKELEKKLCLLEYIEIEKSHKISLDLLKQLEESKLGIQTSLSQLEAELDSSKVEIIGIDRKLTEQNEIQFKIDMDIEKLESSIAVNKERLGGLENQKIREKEFKTGCETEIQKNLIKLSEFRTDIEHIKSEIELEFSELQKREQIISGIKDDLNLQDKSLNDLKYREIEIRKEITTRHTILQNENVKALEISNNKKKISDQRNEIIHNKKILLEKKTLKEQELQKTEKEKERIKSNLDSSFLDIEKNKQLFETKSNIIHKKFGERKEYDARLSTLKSLKESLVGYFTGVKEVLLEKKRGNLTGCIGVVADLIRTSFKYERAIEVALGSNIQNIVTEKSKDAKQAIEYLKSIGKGRATFLPLDLIRYDADKLRDNIDFITKKDGVIGWAIDLIEFDSVYKIIMEYLLGKVIIVSNLDVATDVFSSTGNKGYRLVTLDGEMINPAGAITGGSIDKNVPGLLGREREIEELTKTLHILERELVEEENNASNLKGIISSLELSIQNLTKDYRDIEMLLLDIKNQLIRYSDEEMLILNRLTEIDEIEKKVEEESNNSFRQKVSLEKELFEFQTILEQITKNENESLEIIDQNRKKYDELQKELTEAKMNFAAKQGKLSYFETSEINIQKSIEELNIYLNRYTENLSKFDQDKLAWENDNREKEKRVIELFENKQNQGKEIFSIEEKHRELQETIRVKEDKYKEIKKDFDKLQGDWYEQEIKNHEIELRVSTLIEKLKTDFAQDPDQLSNLEIQEEIDTDSLKEKVDQLKIRMSKMEPINVMAIEEYKQVSTRLEFLMTQKKDLEQAKDSLLETIEKINRTSDKNFKETFELIKNNFIYVFKRFFNGGTADLTL